MAKELSVLQQQAEAITTEVNKGANTSSRIGGMFSDMLDYNEEKRTELNTKIDNRTTEYNVSVNNPTSGTNGGNKYDLAGAIAQVPSELRTDGLKVSFLNSAGKPESWKYQGGSWAVANFIKEADGGNKILTWVTDAATTRKQVAANERKGGMQISYKPDGEDWVNEQYVGASFSDTEWAKDSNWQKIPNESAIKAITDSVNSLKNNIEETKNKYDLSSSEVIWNTQFTNDGRFQSGSSWTVGNKIKTNEGQYLYVYCFKENRLSPQSVTVWFFDINDNPISKTSTGSNGITQDAAPSNVAYSRVQLLFKKETVSDWGIPVVYVVNNSEEKFVRELKTKYLPNLILRPDNIPSNAIQGYHLASGSIDSRHLKHAIEKSSIIDLSKYDILEDTRIDNGGNKFVAQSNMRAIQDFIPFSYDEITTDANVISLFDSNFGFIVRLSPSPTLTIRRADYNDCCYYRMSWMKDKGVHVCKGGAEEFTTDDYEFEFEKLSVNNSKVDTSDLSNIKGSTVSEALKSSDSNFTQLSTRYDDKPITLYQIPLITKTDGICQISEPTGESTIDDFRYYPSVIESQKSADPLFRYSCSKLRITQIYPLSRVDSAMPVNLGYSVEFFADCKEFEVIMYSSVNAVIVVDKIAVSDHISGTSVSTSVAHVKVTFKERKKRHILLSLYGGFGGIKTDKDGIIDRVYDNRGLIAYDGDSIMEGAVGATTAKNAIYSIPGVVSTMLGYDAYDAGIGGTGYLQILGDHKNMVNRFDETILPYNPEILVSMGGLNDSGLVLDEVKTAIDTYWDHAREALPNSYLVAVSPFNPTATPLSNIEEITEHIRLAALRNKIPFIDTVHSKTYDSFGNVVTNNGNNKNWITGTGNAGSSYNPNDGNRYYYISSDNTHCTTMGYRYVGAKIGLELYKLLLSDRYFSSLPINPLIE